MDIVIYPTCPNTGKSYEDENPRFDILSGEIIVESDCPICGEEHTFEV